MKILNCYSGIGGNRKLWGDEHDITAVENEQYIADAYKLMYPNDTVVVGDAHQYLLDHFKEFDFIWSSPPCPTHSRARYGLGFHGKDYVAVYPDMRLYQEILLLKHYFRGRWAVENVQAFYDPLVQPRSIGRHWFWSNFPIENIKVSYAGLTGGLVTQSGKVLHAKSVTELQKEIGVNLDTLNIKNKRLLLRNCVEPKVGLHILNAAQNVHFNTAGHELIAFDFSEQC